VRLRRQHRHGQVPAARRGDRAMMAPTIALWAAVPAALLLVLGGVLALIGGLGLLRLPDFYQRLHAPTLSNTLGCGSVLVASLLYFSVLHGRLMPREVLITVFIVMTSPVTAMLLIKAGRY